MPATLLDPTLETPESPVTPEPAEDTPGEVPPDETPESPPMEAPGEDSPVEIPQEDPPPAVA